jgi:hypothetical protein
MNRNERENGVVLIEYRRSKTKKGLKAREERKKERKNVPASTLQEKRKLNRKRET